jgi:hypothetical protein
MVLDHAHTLFKKHSLERTVIKRPFAWAWALIVSVAHPPVVRDPSCGLRKVMPTLAHSQDSILPQTQKVFFIQNMRCCSLTICRVFP